MNNGSGEGKEEPFEPGPVGAGSAVAVEGALLQAGRDDLETGPVQRPGGRGELVTTSVQSRPCSITLMTPPIWPWAQRSRLIRAAIV